MSKTIKAVFVGRFCKTAPIFQFDTGDKLQIVNLDLPATYTVDFANSLTGESKPVLATSDTVAIPPEFVVPGSEIYAWIWLTDDNGGHTQCQAVIPVDIRARRTETTPTPAQQSAWDAAVDALNDATDGIPAAIDAALEEAKESGEFDGPTGPKGDTGDTGPAGLPGEDGADGSGVWYTTVRVSGSEIPFVRRRDLIGREGAAVQVHDQLIAPAPGEEGEPTTLYEITSVGTACNLSLLCQLQGEDGYSPAVTITEITGGHRITITDEAHPQGQSFDVMDGSGGGGGGGGITVDAVLSTTSENPVQNKVIALALNSKADASAIPQSVVQYISQTLTDAQKTQARENIGAASVEDLGTVFDIKGDVATVGDLPSTGNRVGDVYFVQEVSAAYVWLETTEHPTGYWEEFGEPIDLSGYATQSWVQQQGYLTLSDLPVYSGGVS